jgi:zinc protease
MAPHPCAWDQALTGQGGTWTFEIRPNRGAETFQPINRNGSQRGGRPIVQFLPYRVHPMRVTQGAEWNPVVTDDFILVPNPGVCPSRPIRIVFEAKPVQAGSN